MVRAGQGDFCVLIFLVLRKRSTHNSAASYGGKETWLSPCSWFAFSCSRTRRWRTSMFERRAFPSGVFWFAVCSTQTSPHPVPLFPRLSFVGGGIHANARHESHVQSLEKRWMEQVGTLKKTNEMTEIERSAPPPPSPTR